MINVGWSPFPKVANGAKITRIHKNTPKEAEFLIRSIDPDRA